MVILRVKPEPDGMTISDKVCASMDASIEWRALPLVLLSFRRSWSVFSPRRARARAKPPAELTVDAVDSGCALELSRLESSLTNDVRFGDSLLRWSSASIQSAGVGGTGPRAATPPGGGRLVGGDVTGSLPPPTLLTLCERLAAGGGPGGGGGRGMPGSHRKWDEDRDLADVGVPIAGVDTALLEEGGRVCDESESVRCGIWRVRCPG